MQELLCGLRAHCYKTGTNRITNKNSLYTPENAIQKLFWLMTQVSDYIASPNSHRLWQTQLECWHKLRLPNHVSIYLKSTYCTFGCCSTRKQRARVRGGASFGRDVQSGAGLVQRRSPPHTRHAARARRDRGLLRGSTRRAVCAPRSAQHYPPPCPRMFGWTGAPCMAASRGCANLWDRLPRCCLLSLPHVPLHRSFHRLR